MITPTEIFKQLGTCADNSQFENVQECGRVRVSAQIRRLESQFCSRIVKQKFSIYFSKDLLHDKYKICDVPFTFFTCQILQYELSSDTGIKRVISSL